MAKTVRSVLKSGLKARKGQVGKRAQYLTRARVLKKLQISLKDFSRLCILKGIYPRTPPKGSKDKSKIYYHSKDIKYLSHEKILNKIREVKTYLKKRARLIGRHELEGELHAPIIKLDHLVRERYPTLIDALRDLDDPLTLLHLFHTLRVRVHKSFTAKNAEMVARLIGEWRNIIISQQALRKVFVSIKGYYFQANMKGQLVTWLVPHQTMQNTPKQVDYTVMTTFLRFYETMLRCVNFKLYKEESITYPPSLQTEEEITKNAIAQLDSTSQSSLSTTTNPKIGPKLQQQPQTQKGKQVSSKVLASALNKQNNEDNREDDDDDDNNTSTMNDDNSQFQQLDPSMQLTDLDAEACKKTFQGAVILVGRETAFEPISLVIRCGGGIALHETSLEPSQLSSHKITHQVIDRPIINDGKQFMGRTYIQPQWIFDSFNMRQMLPIAPYAPGQNLPPHLSPFVDDEKENYIPDQRNELRAWVGLPPLKQSVLQKIQLTEEQRRQKMEDDDEVAYRTQLLQEQKQTKTKPLSKQEQQKQAQQLKTKQQQQQPKQKPKQKMDDGGDDDDNNEIELDMDVSDNDEDDEVEIDDVSDDNFDENTFMNDEEDEDDFDEEEAKIAAKPKPVARPRENTRTDKDLSRIVMNKKDKRLHSRMMFGKGRTNEQARVLTVKREAAAAGIDNPKLPRRNYRPTQHR